MKQKILVVDTYEPTLRAEIFGWDNVEDPNRVVLDKPIGMTLSSPSKNYDCVLRALADGWSLLGPPLEIKNKVDDSDSDVDDYYITYTWWLYQDC